MEKELRPFWARIFEFNWKFGLFLVLIICIPRFILVLEANKSGNYGSIGVIMLISAIAPFLFLSRYGQKKTGITRSQKYKPLLLAFVTGLIASIILYLLESDYLAILMQTGTSISGGPITYRLELKKMTKRSFLQLWR